MALGGLAKNVIKAVVQIYFRLFHRLELEGFEHLPPRGPAIVLLNHASLLDVPALMALDPYPDTVTVVKSSMFRLPIIGWALRQWRAIPVEREGRDLASLRAMLEVVRSGSVLAVAAEGRRTRSGRLEPINPVLARFAVSAGVPIVPVGISGSFQALPPGAILPRPHKIMVRVGHAFHLPRGTDVQAAAQRIRSEIAALLPQDMQPLAESVSTASRTRSRTG
jgi:1-acyl-sn-glycerol-3-phosphate acyltransferase